MFDFSSLPDLTTMLMAMGLLFIGSFVQTAIGFGLAIVTAPLLYMLSPEFVPAPIVMVAFCNSLLNAYQHKKDIALGGLKMAIYGRIPGSIAGGILLLYVSSSVLSLALGIFVLLAVAISLLPVRFEPTPRRMAIAGLFSGFMGTSSGIGGPPMALLLQHQEANSLRANLAAFFVFSSLLSLIVLACVGHLTWHHILMTLPLLPMAWLGYISALRVIQYVSKKSIRYFALILCLVSGLTAIVESLHSF